MTFSWQMPHHASTSPVREPLRHQQIIAQHIAQAYLFTPIELERNCSLRQFRAKAEIKLENLVIAISQTFTEAQVDDKIALVLEDPRIN
jgi:hypothetical protein